MWALALVLALSLAAAERPGRVSTYAVVLQEPPVGRRLSRARRGPARGARAGDPEIRALVQEVERTQQPVRAQIEQMGLRITGSTRHLLNAVFVQATAEQARQLPGLLGSSPGVRGVVRMQRYRPMLNAAADLINAPAAWSALGGVSNAGAGITIAIIDSGIDNTNPAFQDPSLATPAGYPLAQPADLPYTNSKIIVARSYLKPSGAIDPTVSRPDDYTPRDLQGHGTFIAMIAAGQTVTAPNGPTITGIAPKAFLGNYKVSGSTDINDGPGEDTILSAMDDAISDGMDIINLSLGSIAVFGPGDQFCTGNAGSFCDVVAEAVAIATEQYGVVVVAAAGNDGDVGVNVPTLNTISSPATAPDAIGVGATTNSRQLTSTLRGGAGAPGSLQSVPALFGNGPHPNSPITGRIRNVQSLGDDGTACNPLPANSLAGGLALVIRGNCDFSVKVGNAAAAGATAVVVYNVSGHDDIFGMTGLVSATIPSVLIGNTAGQNLAGYISSTSGATVTLDPQLVSQPTTPDLIAGFSSRGPSIDLSTKPDLVAPGTSIFSTTQNLDANGAEYDSTRFTSLDGTSFSTALVSGAVALVEQQFPSISATQIISAVVNTASPSILDNGSQARETAMGAGKLNAQAAVKTAAVFEPSSFSFGLLDRTVSFPIGGQVNLTNVSSASQTFQVQVQQRDPDSNARITVNGGSSTSGAIGAGQTGQVTVALGGSLPRPGLYEGVLTVTGPSTSLRIPYHYAVASGTPANILAVAGDGVVGAAGQPLPQLLILKLIDNLGLPISNTSVQFRVTQGSGKIVQADATTDVYGIAAADVDLGPEIGDQSFSATAGGLTVTFLDTARATPTISSGGVVNGASFASGQAVAPGSIISIFGSNLAETIAGAARLPLPLALGAVSVSFDQPAAGLSIPGRFFFVSPGQLNVQVPWEFAGLTSVMLKVRIDDTVSAVYTLQLSDYAPGIFEYTIGGQKLGVVTHADGSIVTPSSPAKKGETVIVYATGVGPVDQQQASGSAAGAQPLAHTTQTPAVTVGSQSASVLFSGLAPFFVGLYQLNVTIPSGTPSGTQPLVITTSGIAGNAVNVPIQ